MNAHMFASLFAAVAATICMSCRRAAKPDLGSRKSTLVADGAISGEQRKEQASMLRTKASRFFGRRITCSCTLRCAPPAWCFARQCGWQAYSDQRNATLGLPWWTLSAGGTPHSRNANLPDHRKAGKWRLRFVAVSAALSRVGGLLHLCLLQDHACSPGRLRRLPPILVSLLIFSSSLSYGSVPR